MQKISVAAEAKGEEEKLEGFNPEKRQRMKNPDIVPFGPKMKREKVRRRALVRLLG